MLAPPVTNVLHRVAAGDRAAVRECLARYGGLVWSLVRRSTSDAAEAEDAVQEIFVDVWQSASRFDPAVASEATFIAMIARRRLIDRARRRNRDGSGDQILLPRCGCLTVLSFAHGDGNSCS